MKRALALVALTMFVGGTMVGCEASAKVGDDADHVHSTGTSSSVKKTTTIQPDGDRTTKIETHTSNP